MSKRFIVVSFLIFLTSACARQVTVIAPTAAEVQNTQPVPSNTVEAIPTATVTQLVLAVTEMPLQTFESICQGASAPQVMPGQQVTVIADNTDKLKLRSEPKISSETVLMELDRLTQLKIVEGFVCVHSNETETSYWFWKVEVIPTGEIGWVAEGDSSQYFIKMASGQSLPNLEFLCPGAPGPHVVIGQEVTVVTEDTDKLKLRSEPKISPDTLMMELDKFTQLKILDHFTCVYSDETETSYWFWKVEVISTGMIGWVAEGDSLYYFIE